MISRSACLSVTILPVRQSVNSSTSRREFTTPFRVGKTLSCRHKIGVSGEVCLSPMTCKTRVDSRNVSRPVDAFGERKGAAENVSSPFANSNRKERLNSASEVLFIGPNNSAIALFEDQQRQQSGAAFELVMDRSAECIAGGCDAV